MNQPYNLYIHVPQKNDLRALEAALAGPLHWPRYQDPMTDLQHASNHERLHIEAMLHAGPTKWIKKYLKQNPLHPKGVAAPYRDIAQAIVEKERQISKWSSPLSFPVLFPLFKEDFALHTDGHIDEHGLWHQTQTRGGYDKAFYEWLHKTVGTHSVPTQIEQMQSPDSNKLVYTFCANADRAFENAFLARLAEVLAPLHAKALLLSEWEEMDHNDDLQQVVRVCYTNPIIGETLNEDITFLSRSHIRAGETQIRNEIDYIIHDRDFFHIEF